MNNKNGIILIDKPKGITSFDVIRLLKKKFGTKKIGHSGVLDKPASGLMICAVNRATKLLSIFEEGYKIYIADIVFGIKTDTLDMQGSIVDTKYTDITKNDLKKVIDSFRGEILQSVPKYSNVRINGKKLYRYALNHESIELPKRKVTIYDIELVEFGDNSAKIKVKCSKGTYIRSLAYDIGESLNTFGTIRDLRRIFVYPFSIDKAKDVDNAEITPINEALSFLPSISVSKDLVKNVLNGVEFSRIVKCDKLQNGLYRVLDDNKNFIALIISEKDKVSYKFVLN